MLTYRAIAPGLSTVHVRHVADLIRRHRVGIDSRWRRLPPARQALLVLVHLRCGDPYAHLAVSFGVGATTAYRYICETVDLLAATADSLPAVLAARVGCEVTILDGTIITSHRVRWTSQHKQWYCARKKTYGVNLQALTDEHGNPSRSSARSSARCFHGRGDTGTDCWLSGAGWRWRCGSWRATASTAFSSGSALSGGTVAGPLLDGVPPWFMIMPNSPRVVAALDVDGTASAFPAATAQSVTTIALPQPTKVGHPGAPAHV